ncbi:MAG: cytochrome c-type biogenesis protein CcmH [Alphaproteobacteria bacterium]|nr:cytochrome c-type biogenesis protein CcmH [Alphaproteobacteria bacterium]
MKTLLCALFFCLFLPAVALAVQPDEMMQDAVLESRARVISKQLRCLVCQGEDIDESAAGLARDLRLLVRERLSAGDSDAQVLSFVQERYGDYVLMKPPVAPRTWILWLTPFLVLGAGFAFVWRLVRRGFVRRDRA